MKSKKSRESNVSRRKFICTMAVAGTVAATAKPSAKAFVPDLSEPKMFNQNDVTTNIAEAAKIPRTKLSMPGKFPGVVAEVHHPGAVIGSKPDQEIANKMLRSVMISLTGATSTAEAWKMLFEPKDRIGIKVNPIAGKLISNSHELTRAIIASLEDIGVPRSNIILWDRREEQLKEAGFTEENYPGIKCIGTEYMVKEGEKEVWKGEDRLDKDHFYEFNIVGEYDEQTMPYMINGGTKSYYSTILTSMVDKVINVPVMKNHGRGNITLALKNMAFGTTSNTGRGHAIVDRYNAEVCAFSPVRDKTVLNIIDALRGCYHQGPVPPARYIWNPERVFASTDPVAIDTIASEVIFPKRISEKLEEPNIMKKRDQLLEQCVRAEKLGLGIYDRSKIDHRKGLSVKEKEVKKA